MEMIPAETEWLSCHFGHDVGTHKRNYRLHTSAVEITKVAPMLNHIDSGTVGRRSHSNQPNSGVRGLSFMLLLPLTMYLKTSKSLYNGHERNIDNVDVHCS